MAKRRRKPRVQRKSKGGSSTGAARSAPKPQKMRTRAGSPLSPRVIRSSQPGVRPDDINVIRDRAYVPVPPRSAPGTLAQKAMAKVRPISKQRADPQKERIRGKKPLSLKAPPKTSAQLAAFNEKRRKRRNSDGYAFDAGCVPRPHSGKGAAARWDPNHKKKRANEARRWC